MDSPKENPSKIPGRPCLWTYADGPGPGGKPVTFLRTERRRGRRAGTEAGARRSGRTRRLTPFAHPICNTHRRRPGQFSREQEIEPDRRRSPTEASGRSQPGIVKMSYNNCVFLRSRDCPISGNGNQTNRLQLREKFGALKLEFAFADSTTRRPVSRPTTHSWLEEPVFGRRISAVSIEINGWLGIETLVPGIHRRFPDMTSRLATLRRRVHMPYTDRSCRLRPAAWQTIFCCSSRSPIRTFTRRFMIGSCIPVPMTMVPGVLSGHPGPHVSLWWIAGDWQSWPSHSATSVNTDTSRSPSLVFLLLRHWPITSENSAGIKNSQVGNSHQFTSALRSRQALHSPLELSSTGFLFSQDSPVVDKRFTEISRS